MVSFLPSPFTPSTLHFPLAACHMHCTFSTSPLHYAIHRHQPLHWKHRAAELCSKARFIIHIQRQNTEQSLAHPSVGCQLKPDAAVTDSISLYPLSPSAEYHCHDLCHLLESNHISVIFKCDLPTPCTGSRLHETLAGFLKHKFFCSFHS